MENFETETVEAEVAEESPKRDIRRLGGDKRAQAIREAMDMLIAAVDVDNYDVDEYNVLGNIMVRSGIMWRCAVPHCKGVNHDNCGSCDSCGRRRPPKRAEPKPDHWA